MQGLPLVMNVRGAPSLKENFLGLKKNMKIFRGRGFCRYTDYIKDRSYTNVVELLYF